MTHRRFGDLPPVDSYDALGVDPAVAPGLPLAEVRALQLFIVRRREDTLVVAQVAPPGYDTFGPEGARAAEQMLHAIDARFPGTAVDVIPITPRLFDEALKYWGQVRFS